jgi:PAS domain S-box-containing protein
VTLAAAHPIRLLLVDDDVRFGDYLRIILKRARPTFVVDVASSVQAALTELAQGRHHVCLLDYRLGVEDGLEVLRRAHARDIRTPIVLLMGEQDESLELTAIEQGAADYLNKSELDPRRLEQTVSRAIARHRVESALRERETRVADAEARALVMATQVGLDGQYVKVSPRFCDLLGYSDEELRSMRSDDITHPDDVATDLAQREVLLKRAAGSVELEKRYVRKDGGIVWAYVNCSLVDAEGGAPLCFLNYVRDIGDQKRAEEALRASEQRYSSMVRNAPYGIFEATRDGRFLHGNPALMAMLGVDSESAVPLIDPDALYGSAEERQRVFEQLAKPGRSSVDTSWNRADGSRVLVHIGADVPADVGDVITGVVEDVTHRKRLEDQLRQAHKMEAVGQLAGGVAHDFNNLLTAILGYTEFLKEDFADVPHVAADLEEVHRAAATAASLTAQLLAFSRKQVLQTRVLSLNDVVDEMRNLLSRVLGEDVTLVTNLSAAVPRVEADPVQLQQVLLNLAANARDAMPLGGKLVIETALSDTDTALLEKTALPPGRYAVISVADDGCGMDRQTKARIFEPFFTTKGQAKGTGLGLATVYGIVSQSGGEIVCDTEVGVGTTFTILLPVTDHAAAATGPAAGAAPTVSRGTGTILLVEDQPAVRELTRRILQAQGYQVIDTGNPETALDLLGDTRIDLLLTDVVMPELSGPDLAKRVRRQHPDVRVMFMSGYAGHSALNATDGVPLILKPFTPQSLALKVREVLDARDVLEQVELVS